jgi:hypothetical protein
MSQRSSRTPVRRSRRRESSIALLIFCIAVIGIILLVSPREVTQRALNVSPDGSLQSVAAGLRITEIMADNASAFPDEYGNFPDWLEIANLSDYPINTKGLTLSNRPDRARFIFPDITLAPGEYIVIFCDKTNQNELGKPLHAKFKISSITASVYLFDTYGYVIDKVEDTPTLNANESYALQADGNFIKTDLFSPGYPNTPEGHEAYMSSYMVESGQLVINEICPAPRSGLRDEDGELSDWIELKNNSGEPIDLSILALSDNEERPVKWTFPEGALIAPHGYYLIFASGKNRDNPGSIPHSNFSLAAEGETLTLSTRQGQLIDRITYPNMPADHSYGRDEQTGEWQVFTITTPGVSNDAAGFQKSDDFLRAINPYKVYITEVLSSNSSIPPSAGAPISDWAEIYNAGSQVQDISRWGLSDNINWPRKWQFPEGTSIWPGEYKVIRLDKSKTPGTDAAALSASFAIKRAGGEVVTLSDPDGRVLDRIVTPEIPTDISYGRAADFKGFFYFDAPTPGSANSVGFVGFAPVPAFSRDGGLYKENITVSIQVPKDSQVRYTLDGAIPTIANGIVYEEPLEIKDTTVLRARAFSRGLQPSKTITATYVMKTYFTLPVVALTTDPFELWNQETGMLALGEGIDILQYKKIRFKDPWPTYALHGKKHRPGYAEMFMSDTAEVVFSQDVTFGLIGQYSLDMPQKSFKVQARAKYGPKYFYAALFDDRPFDLYKSFVLRVSGNDAVWTRMVDGVQSRLVDQLDTTVIHQAWKPVIVYLNGQYWGHYNMRERVSRYFVAQHEGIPIEEADNMTILEANGKSYWGSEVEYKELVKTAKTLSPASNPEDLKYLTDRIDVDNYFDYMILEAFFANSDTGNIRFYKLPGGKWRWILFDLDYGLFDSNFNGIKIILDPRGTGVNRAIDNTLIRKLLENPQMQDKFLRRFGEIFRQLTTEVMLRQVEECYNILQPEMMMHYERWASYHLKSISSEQPQTVDGSMRYWNSRVNRLKNVVKKRPTNCWKQVKEWFKLTDAQMIDYFGPMPEMPDDVI